MATKVFAKESAALIATILVLGFSEQVMARSFGNLCHCTTTCTRYHSQGVA